MCLEQKVPVVRTVVMRKAVVRTFFKKMKTKKGGWGGLGRGWPLNYIKNLQLSPQLWGPWGGQWAEEEQRMQETESL